MTSQAEENISKRMQARYDEITALTDATCAAHLDDAYAQRCRELAAKFCRRRPSPLELGHAKTWAAAIIRTIGQINFLAGKRQTPHLPDADLCERMGVDKSSMQNKARQIHNMLNINHINFHGGRPGRMEDIPMTWLILVNSIIVDARTMPREVQEEAYRKGLIPYLPK